ncbi:MAG: response regulator transcription factor [Niastella sp.]|nr:response regulator transcription factor [Niastella sp.]
MKWKLLLPAAVALILIVSWTATRKEAVIVPAYDQEKEMIMMRDIGHQVLLQSGDFSSRVLPVRKVAEHEYLLQFERPFTFVPDSLVKVINRVVKARFLPTEYMVEVITCSDNEVIFGYAINRDSTQNIVPCLGRTQEKACYKIKLMFPSAAQKENNASWYLLGGSLVLIGLSLLTRILYNRRRKENITEEPVSEAAAPVPAVEETTEAISIGQYRFYPVRQLLVLGELAVPLTAKESKLLQVFTTAPNEMIDRNRLLKEVWEDEGVIVGRSLDMFVSKLRKKLQQDPGISIINVHGKGYKLTITA